LLELNNLPFVVVSLSVVRKTQAPVLVARMCEVLFMDVLLTAFGSAYYDWHSDNDTLVWDCIPITLVFMSVLVATVTELMSRRLGTVLFVRC